MTNSSFRGGWQLRMVEARRWKKAILDFILINKLSPKVPLKTAKLTLIRCSGKEPDWDGLTSGFKHIIDGLVHAGVIQDDKMSNIGQPTYRWEKAKYGQGRIEIEVEEQ